MPIVLTLPSERIAGSDTVDLVPILGQVDAANNRRLTLRALVEASIFSWARAQPGDVLPSTRDGKRDRRGWWCEAQSGDYPIDAFGSRLWLLERAKLTSETVRLARSYIEEALAWLVEDGIAEAVAVEVQRQGRGGLSMAVTVTRGTGSLAAEDLRFSFLWELT